MNYRRLQTISFLAILLFFFGIVVWMLRPFFDILAFGIILAILFHPVYLKIRGKLKSPSWSSLLTVLIMLAIITVPILLLSQRVISELLDSYHKLTVAGGGDVRQVILQHTPIEWQGYVQTGLDNFNATLARFTNDAFHTLSNVLSNLASFFIALTLLLFTVFYLLRDGERIIKILMDISPMASTQENALFRRITSVINGVVKGQFMVALIQGLTAMTGFLIFGVPQPILWGLVTIMTALVPAVGTAISVIPAVLVLFFSGHQTAAIGMAMWGALGVGTIDNFISPRLVGSRIKLHPLLVLLAILGGIQLFGFLGFLLGPILMAAFLALVDIYRTDFKNNLEE